MEFGCSPDIESALVKYNSNSNRTGEYPECCTRYQQKIFTKKREKMEERSRPKLATRRASPLRQMAPLDEVISEDHVATKDNMKRISDVETITVDDGRRHVHFGDEIVTEEFPFARLNSIDPNESAVDMIEAYKRECANMRIKPISKLLEQLARLDQLSTPIDTLDLKNVRLENRSCEALEAVLSRMHMTTIDLERTGLEDDGMIALCEMVEFYECASRLNFAGSSKLKPRAWFCLGKMLKKVDFIEMVDVRYCALDEQGLTSMLRALRANCTLSTLHLEGNNLTGKGIFILMAAMKFNENLKELYLGSNHIAPEDCQNIGNILRTNHTLTILDLRDNSIQNAGLRCVCAGIAEQQTGLFSLNLATCNITPEGMHHIAVMLPCTKSLQDINLSNNRVGDFGIMMAKLSLLANRSLLKLTLCNTRITCEGAIALAEFVAESKMLEQLDLRDNDIRIAGLMALSLAHKMNYKLVRLSMPRTIKIEPRDKEMAKNLIDNIEEYIARNIKDTQQRRKKQEEDAAAAAAVAAAEAEKEELPPKTEAELEEERKLISVLADESSEATEDPFSADIVGQQDSTPGKALEKALDSLILINQQTDVNDDEESQETSPNDESPAAESSMQQQQPLNIDLLSDNSNTDVTPPLLELAPTLSNPIRTGTVDSPTLPDLVGESPPKNNLSELHVSQDTTAPTQPNVNNSSNSSSSEVFTKPDLMSGDLLSNVGEMPLDVASVSYPPLDLLSGDDGTGQLVDVTQGTPGDSLLDLGMDAATSTNTTPTPDVSQVNESQRSGITVDLVDGLKTNVLGAGYTDSSNRNNETDAPSGNRPV